MERKDTPNQIPQTNGSNPIPNGTNGRPHSLNGYMFPTVPASPPKFFTLQEIINATDNLKNMALAHEIAVNKDFKIEKKEYKDPIAKQIANTVVRAFWDILEEQLNEDPPCYTQAMVLLAEIKEGIFAILLPQHNKLRIELHETLDLDLIKQKLEHKAVDFMHYASYIISFCSKLCAPSRDEQIQKLATVTDITPLFRGILELLEEMRLDMANYTLTQLRPEFINYSIDYEKKKFKEFLETQKDFDPTLDGLEQTKNWLHRSFSKFTPEDKPTVQQIISQAYIDLLDWNETFPFPETVIMDEKRFLDFKNMVEFSAWVASVLTITFNSIPRDLQTCQEFKKSLKNHVALVLEGINLNYNAQKHEEMFGSVVEIVLSDVKKILQERHFPLLDDQAETSLRTQIMDLIKDTNPVRCLMRKRIFTFLKEVLKLGLKNPKSIPYPPGLSFLSGELSSLIGQFVHITRHNQSVFGEYYHDIIEPLLPAQ